MEGRIEYSSEHECTHSQRRANKGKRMLLRRFEVRKVVKVVHGRVNETRKGIGHQSYMNVLQNVLEKSRFD